MSLSADGGVMSTQNPFPVEQKIRELVHSPRAFMVLAGATVVAFGCIVFTHPMPALRHVTNLVWLFSIVIAAYLGYLAFVRDADRRIIIVAGWSAALFLAIQLFAPRSAVAHPIFQTPLTGAVSARPAILVDELREGELFGNAELYLKVQSSRFPSDVAVLFPLNRGDFQGCTSRFIQLPFEVVDKDLLLLNVIDDQSMTPQEEETLLLACQAAGFCLVAGTYYCEPDLGRLLQPGFMTGSKAIGDGIVMELRSNPFRNMGSAEYVVQANRPSNPQDANRVSLLSEADYSRAQVRLYFPPAPLR